MWGVSDSGNLLRQALQQTFVMEETWKVLTHASRMYMVIITNHLVSPPSCVMGKVRALFFKQEFETTRDPDTGPFNPILTLF